MHDAFHILTLGCKVNQYESQAIREAWTAYGLRETQNPAHAGTILVHTCAVTAAAVADCRAAIRRMHRAAPHARIVAAGCAVQVAARELAGLPGVAALVPQADKPALLKAETLALLDAGDMEPRILYSAPPRLEPCARSGLDRQDGRGEPGARAGRLNGRDAENPIPAPPGAGRAWPEFRIASYERARPVVKIQDGCGHGCAYCIVPVTRGAPVSRPVQSVYAEVERLLARGFRECVISGVNLRHYGRDLKENVDFWDLMAGLEARFAPEWAGRARFRLSSLEPGQLHARALEVLSGSRMICPHIHLSLQSGSPAVLRGMGRRHYAPEELHAFFAALSTSWPIFALGADLLLGFPGETEAEFQETLACCEALPLTYAHVFPFSPRPGTPAADMAGQVEKRERARRAARVRALAERKAQAFARALAALPRLHVIAERSGARALTGACEFYVECRVAGFPPGTGARELIAVRPRAVEAGAIACAGLGPRAVSLPREESTNA